MKFHDSKISLAFLISLGLGACTTTQGGNREQSRFTSLNQPVVVMNTAAVNLDCTAIKSASVTVSAPPSHGRAHVSHTMGGANYPLDNPRSKCNGQISKRFIVTYTPKKGFTGIDQFVIGRSLEGRGTQYITQTVVVR